MSAHLSTPEMASPASTSRTSFFLPPESPRPPTHDGGPRLREQFSFSGSTTDEDGAWKPDVERSANLRPRRRNRFLKAFLPHPDNPTVLQRTYGLVHGHSFNTNLAKEQVVGWRAGLKWATIGTASVFVANSIFLVSTVVAHGSDEGVGTLYSGNCNIVSNYDTWIHILINVLSTVLLGGSSYVMQCLNAPTREQVDRAHARGKSLDIGMPSFKNARRVGWKQTGLWIGIAVSAMPLHVFWNSAVFSTLESNQFDMFVVPKDFNSTDDFSCDLVAGCDNAESLWRKSKAGQLQFLDNADCISTYSANFLGGRRNVMLVTSNITRGWKENTTQADSNANVFGILMSRKFDLVLDGSDWTPNAWWCEEAHFVTTNDSTSFQSNWNSQVWDDVTLTCSSTLAASKAADLQVVVQANQTRTNAAIALQQIGTGTGNVDAPSYLYNVDHCLSEEVDQVCQLQSAHYIWLIVILCNAFKLGCMFLTAKVLRRAGEPLVVVGDAVASFLEKPDEYTEGNCLMSSRSSTKPKPKGGRVWRLKRPLWLRSSSKWSWIKTLTVCVGTLASLVTVLLLFGVFSDVDGTAAISWNQLPFGGVSPYTIINLNLGKDPSSFGTLMSVLLFVNCPQIVFSCIYFMYNSLLTAMVAMQEFSRFSFRRRTLRVSTPVGAQRYTYWLQLPYTYSFPLLACSGLMHWFISQSLFLARIQVIDEYGAKMQSGVELQPPPNGPIEIGSLYTLPSFSPKAFICCLSLGAAMVIVIFGLSFRRHHGGVPFVANNSLAISAACHPPPRETDAHLRPVMWGAVSQPDGDIPGHCSFSGEAVEPPIVGQRYA